MKAKGLYGVLTKLLEAGEPILITGKPGIGKTDIVKAAAANLGYALEITHPVVSDPVDYKGLPTVVNGEATFLPFGDLNKLVTADEPLVYFFDDLGQAPQAVQAAAMQLLLNRSIDTHKVSDHVRFVAATNRPKDRAGVTGLLEPVKSRFATIIELNPSADDWTDWAIANDMPSELIAFVQFRKDTVENDNPPTAEITNSCCPRTLAALGRLFKLGLDKDTRMEVINGAIGEGFGTEFLSFLQIYEGLPDIDELFKNPKSYRQDSNLAIRYATTVAIGRNINKENVDNFSELLERMDPEFAAICVMIGQKSSSEILNRNKKFYKWIQDNAHNFMLSS